MAGSSVIGALRVNLGLDSAQFSSGLNTAGSRMTKFAAMAGKAAAGLVVTVRTAMVAMGVSAINAASEIERLSQVANTAPQQFQGWAAGARSVGIEQEKLADILKDVNDRVGDFVQTGGGPMKDFFEKIAPQVGVTADMFRDLSGADALQLYVSSLQKANVNQQDFTFYMEAMASDSTLLIPLLRDGGKAMTEYADRAERMGAIMSGEMLASMREGKTALSDMHTAIEGMKNTIGAQAVPAVKALASAVTAAAIFFHTHAETMAEGLRTLAGIAVVVATTFAVKYAVAVGVTAVRAMTAAVVQSIALEMALGAQSRAAAVAGVAAKALAGAMAFLRSALISTGIGALVVAAGYLVGKFIELVGAAGGFGNALSLVGDVAQELWTRLGTGARGVYLVLKGVATGIASGFVSAFAVIAKAWDGLVNGMATAWNSIAESAIGETLGMGMMGTSSLSQAMEGVAEEMREGALASISAGGEALKAAATTPLESLQALRDTVTGAAQSAATLGRSAAGAGGALEEMGEKGKAAGKKTKEAVDEAAKAADRGADALGDMFGGLLDRTTTLKDAVSGLLMEIAKMQGLQGFRAIFGAGGAFGNVGGWLGGLIGANANGTSHWRGGATAVNERGWEVLDLPNGTRVWPHGASQRLADGEGGGGRMALEVSLKSDMLEAKIRDVATPLAAGAVAQYDRNGVRTTIAEALKDPRVR